MRRPPKPPGTPAPGHDTRRTGARRSPKPSAQCENRPSHQTQYPRFHELAHALVAEDPDAPQLDYAQGELIAESVAWCVCQTVGLDSSANSIPYLASWAEQASLEVLEQTAQLTGRLATRIESALLAEPAGTEPGGQEVVDAAQPVAV
jgi:hypothetical protein